MRLALLPFGPFLLVAALVLTALPSTVRAGGAPSVAERARLAAGEVLIELRPVPEGGPPEVTARGVVQAPPARVWPLVDRCGQYHGLLPRVVESREISRSGAQVDCYLRLDLPFPFSDLWHETRAQHRALPDGSYERRWTLLRGSYRSNAGYWRVEPFGEGGGHSLLTYHARAEPDLALPASLLDLAQRRSLPGIFTAFRERLEPR